MNKTKRKKKKIMRFTSVYKVYNRPYLKILLVQIFFLYLKNWVLNFTDLIDLQVLVYFFIQSILVNSLFKVNFFFILL